MDIEELSKSQIVLLVLLISFVTSMATGIVTVSLMSQAPTSVAQTVNRVIEQTIREVAAPGQSQSVAAAVASTKTVVVKASDEISGAVKKSSPSVVRLYSGDGSTFLGIGVVIDGGGAMVTDLAAIGAAEQVSAQLSGGLSVQANVTTRDAGLGVAFLSVATSSLATSTPAFIPIGTSAATPVLGQMIVMLSGQSTPWVGSGLISSLTPPTASAPALVKTDISGDNVLYGSPLIDTDGNLVGMSTQVSRAVSGTAFVPISAISADLMQSASAK